MNATTVQEPKTSTLRTFLDEIVDEIVDDNREFKHKELGEFKTVVLTFLEKCKGTIREHDRRKMMLIVSQDERLEHLQSYIYNSLLKFEGLGVVNLLPR